jgi:hypothetical protein
MPRGGARPGTGGARPGSGRKRKAVIAPKAYVGLDGMPLDYMLAVMRDPEVDPRRRDQMAAAAAPFVHRRLSPQPFDEDAPELPLVMPGGKKEAELEAARGIDTSTALGALEARRRGLN